MRIAIINDDETTRIMLTHVIKRTQHTMLWTAFSGPDGISQCKDNIPDLILMDMQMPGMDGVETTRIIMQNTPCPVLIVTSSLVSNRRMIFEAMGAGALDVVKTPNVSMQLHNDMFADLLFKIDAVFKLTYRKNYHHETETDYVHANRPDYTFPLVTIGASTGGPAALTSILSCLPADFSAAVVIVQHIDGYFVPEFVKWLDENSSLQVLEARRGELLEAGKVFVAGTDDHLVIQKDGYLDYTPQPTDNPYRPSVDVFFNSVADNWPGQIVSALLTGMGADGAKGLLNLSVKGHATIAQNKDSCVVFGMPRAAIKLGAAAEVLPLDKIANSLIDKVNDISMNTTVKSGKSW